MIINLNKKKFMSKMDFMENEMKENFNYFLSSLKDSKWALTASERNIDYLFECALKLHPHEEMNNIQEQLLKNFPDFNLNKPVDLLLESIIKNHNLDICLTLYAVRKYNTLYPKENFSEVLEKLLLEIDLRRHLFILIEDFPDVDLDFLTLNMFIWEILNSSDIKSKIQNSLKSQSNMLLKAIKFGDFLSGQHLMDEIILCLESQTDLRLWFTLMKTENLDIILDLCDIFKNFLDIILKFFDKFADEIESNYDEELNIQYSHVNLDFEDFVKVFQLFLGKKSIKKQISDFLESKIMTEKNFCFWIDVKSCL